MAVVSRHVELVTTKHGHHRRRIGRHTRSTAAAGRCHAGRSRHARTTSLRLRHGGRRSVLEPVTAEHLLCLLDPLSTFVRFCWVDDLVRRATNALRDTIGAGDIGVLADKNVQRTLRAAVLGREESEHIAPAECCQQQDTLPGCLKRGGRREDNVLDSTKAAGVARYILACSCQ